LVRALVLTAVPLIPAGHRRRPPLAFRVVRALRRAGLVSEARLEEARHRYGSADYRAAEGVMRAVLVQTLQERYDQQMAAVECPVRLVWGDDDTETPLSVAEGAVGRLPRATLTVCPGAGHLTPLTVPDTLRRAVEESLG
jgi:pimeloyl-ACP methyl ester carboxylesterase